MNNPLFNNPVILEERRIASYKGFVKEAVHLVSFDSIEINVLGTSYDDDQAPSMISSPGKDSAASNAYAANAITEISPVDQIVVFPIEGGTAGGSPTEGCELSTEIILSYLDHAIGEDQLTPECNLKCEQILQDIEDLQTITTELDRITKENSQLLELQKQAIATLAAYVENNTLNIATNTAAIAALELLVQKNADAILVNEQNIQTLQIAVARNTQSISALTTIVNQHTADLTALQIVVDSNTARISANAALINQNATHIQEIFLILDGLSDRIGDNTDAIEALRFEFYAYKTIIDKNTEDIQNILNMLSGDIGGISQNGIGTDGEEIILDPNWVSGKPFVDVNFAYGTSNLGYVVSEQEVLCGHSGVFHTANEGEYKFKLFTGLYEVGPITDNAMNFTPPTVAANAPEGTVVYTDESAEQATIIESAMLRIKGNIHIANSGPPGSAGQITLQINVDNTEWVDIDTLFMYFSTTDTIGVDKVIDKAFTFEQTDHTYKLRGKLVLKTAPYANMFVEGSIIVDTVIERGTGVKLSSNVFAKWIAKD